MCSKTACDGLQKPRMQSVSDTKYHTIAVMHEQGQCGQDEVICDVSLWMLRFYPLNLCCAVTYQRNPHHCYLSVVTLDAVLCDVPVCIPSQAAGNVLVELVHLEGEVHGSHSNLYGSVRQYH